MRGIHTYEQDGEVFLAIELTWENWCEICDLDLGPGFRGCYLDEHGRPTDYVTDTMGALWPKAPGMRGCCYVMKGGDFICKDTGPGPFAGGNWFPTTKDDFNDIFFDCAISQTPNEDYENIQHAQLSLFGGS